MQEHIRTIENLLLDGEDYICPCDLIITGSVSISNGYFVVSRDLTLKGQNFSITNGNLIVLGNLVGDTLTVTNGSIFVIGNFTANKLTLLKSSLKVNGNLSISNIIKKFS